MLPVVARHLIGPRVHGHGEAQCRALRALARVLPIVARQRRHVIGPRVHGHREKAVHLLCPCHGCDCFLECRAHRLRRAL